MPILPWSDMLSVGVKAIDSQHQILVGFLNELGDVAQDRGDAWNESLILSRLVAYAEDHFAFEERLMQRVGYAQLQQHVDEHRLLFEQLAALNARSAAGEGAGVQELLVFLRDWLSSHILGTDRALGQALNRMEIR